MSKILRVALEFEASNAEDARRMVNVLIDKMLDDHPDLFCDDSESREGEICLENKDV